MAEEAQGQQQHNLPATTQPPQPAPQAIAAEVTPEQGTATGSAAAAGNTPGAGDDVGGNDDSGVGANRLPMTFRIKM